jgi:transcriptional regulator with AAA-type ATPase domain
VRSTSEPERARTLVGRAHELAVLRSALGDAADGMGRLVLVVGEPGIGKTRLAQEIAGRALAAGHAVAWGAASRLTALRRTGPGFKFCARSVCTPTRF